MDDYHEKEKLIHTIFSKSQVGTSELFALDKNLAKDMLEDMLVMEREFGKNNNGYFGQYVLASYALATGHEEDLREAAKTDNKTPVDEKKMLYVALGEVA